MNTFFVKQSSLKILIFFTINYTIFAPLNVWYMQSTLYQQFPSATSPKPQYCIQILRSELLENARQYFGNPKAWEKKSKGYKLQELFTVNIL